MSESTEIAELREKVKLLERILELKKEIARLEDRPIRYLPNPSSPAITWSAPIPHNYCGGKM